MKKVGIASVIIVAIVVIVFSFNKRDALHNTRDTQSVSEEKDVTRKEGYNGLLLAGQSVPYLTFTKIDYEKALADGKIILLNFYANWCPVCRAEEADFAAGVDALTTPHVIAFRVNYNDNETDEDEEMLAEMFSIPYQHTKVIVKDGKEVFKETAQWSKEDLAREINKVTQ